MRVRVKSIVTQADKRKAGARLPDPRLVHAV